MNKDVKLVMNQRNAEKMRRTFNSEKNLWIKM